MPQTSPQTLQHLGLTDKEVRVYIASLEIGSAPVQIIALKADINRPTAYVVIDNLMKMGLMTRHEQGKKTLYAAEPPERLERLIERQHESLVEREAELKSVLPELKALFNLSETKPRVKYYEGKEAQYSMMREYYQPRFRGKTFYAFSPVDLIEGSTPDRVLEESVKRRVDLGIHLKSIYTSRKDPPPTFSSPTEFREARFLPPDQFPLSTTIALLPEWGVWVYSYKTGIAGLVIEDPDFAQSLKALFDLIWVISTPDAALRRRFKSKRRPLPQRARSRSLVKRSAS